MTNGTDRLKQSIEHLSLAVTMLESAPPTGTERRALAAMVKGWADITASQADAVDKHERSKRRPGRPKSKPAPATTNGAAKVPA